MPAPPGPSDAPIRVLVVDDHRGFAQLLAVALEAEPDLTCVGTAGDGEEGLARVDELAPQVVLVDIQMPGTDGIEVTRRLRSRDPRPAVVVMTAHRDPAWDERAREAGALDLVRKNGSLDVLLDAVRRAGAAGDGPS